MPLGEGHMTVREESRLDLGGGLAPVPGHINIDIISRADIQWDLNKGLPVSDIELGEKRFYAWGDIVGIRSHHLIEHLDSIIPLMNDCYTVMKEGALFELSTPLASTKEYWQDPTHKRGYIPESFLYFCKNSPFEKEQREYGITARFEIIRNEVVDGWQLEVVLKK